MFKFHNLLQRRYDHLDALVLVQNFLIQGYLCSELSASLLETVSLRVLAQYIREYSICALLVKIVLSLDSLQLIMSVGTLTYLETKLFLRIIIYNCTSSLLIITILKINVYFFFLPNHGWHDSFN